MLVGLVFLLTHGSLIFLIIDHFYVSQFSILKQTHCISHGFIGGVFSVFIIH